MSLSREERILAGAALFMCAAIVCFNAFDSAYVGKKLVNTATPIYHTVSSEESTAINDISKDIQSQDTEIERTLPEVSDTESESEKGSKIVNINTATASELKDFLPGIGDVKARAIVDYREKSGGFSSVSELLNVNGIGEKTYNNIRDYCTVE